jgi:ribosome-associated protein
MSKKRTKDGLLKPYIAAVQGMKAYDITVLDVTGLASFADYFILCSGRSHRQVTAIAEFVEQDLKGKGIRVLGTEGLREGHWVLLDYGDVVIHVFYEPVRTFYDLEGLWSDAERLVVPTD